MTINAMAIIPGKTDGCPTMGDYAIKKKMNVSWANKKVGDIVLFDFNHNGTSDHIGILEAINKDGSIVTIEGNTGSGSNTNGGQVQRRKRYKSQVNYFIRPKYNKDVTVAMLLATARAELGVKEKPAGSNRVKYNVWFYGRNQSAFWCCTFVCWLFAHVREPEVIPVVAKPTGLYTGEIPTGLIKRGVKGNNVKQLQLFLNWYHPEWNLKPDKDCGPKTEAAIKSFQKTEGLDPDGEYGKLSYAKALTYKKKAATQKKTTAPAKTSTVSKATAPAAKKTAAKATNAQKLINKMKELAWAYGTAKKKYAYKTGAPKAICKKAMKKYGWADNRAEMSDCGNFVSTVVREAGVSKTFKALHGTKTPFPKTEKGFSIVLTGKKVPSGFLKPGDIIRYKKKNGNQHVLFYFGDGKVCEASHHNRYGAIIKDEKKYNNSSIAKIGTVQVLRAKG